MLQRSHVRKRDGNIDPVAYELSWVLTCHTEFVKDTHWLVCNLDLVRNLASTSGTKECPCLQCQQGVHLAYSCTTLLTVKIPVAIYNNITIQYI